MPPPQRKADCVANCAATIAAGRFGCREKEKEMSYTDQFELSATLIANEFLEKYMPKANGDYVKVYLYIKYRKERGIDYGAIAEALELTEGDVRRAVAYWVEQGVLTAKLPEAAGREHSAAKRTDAESGLSCAAASGRPEQNPAAGPLSSGVEAGAGAKDARTNAAEEPEGSEAPDFSADARAQQAANELRELYKRAEGRTALCRLAKDEEFSQLLFIVQKYMSKILTDNEQQVFAYLYDGLHLPCDVLDYLVDYCVQHDHNNIKYIEKVGLDWAMRGIRDLSAAKKRTRSFDRVKEQNARRREVKTARLGANRGTDYDALLLEQVIRKME